VILKFLTHLFESFGGKNWLFFIPPPEERLKFGDDLEKVKVPKVEHLPILKLVTDLQVSLLLRAICAD
jgi:hypothetical protein